MIEYTLALKILQKLNYDLCLINVELAQEADDISDNVLDRLPFTLTSLTEDERNNLEKYCEYIVFRKNGLTFLL